MKVNGHGSNKKNQSYWKSEKLFFEPESYFEELFFSIQNAKTCIYIEAHIYDHNYLGRKFTLNLLNALKRKVKVYLLVDGYGAFKYPRRWFLLLRKYGAIIRVYNPVFGMKGTLRSIFKLNQRLHKKLWIIDKKIAFLGSLNIDTRHMPKKYNGENWRDTGIMVTGGRVGLLCASFFWDWSHVQRESPVMGDHVFFQEKIRLNHSKYLRIYSNAVFLKKLLKAKKRIWIMNPYFVPDKKILNALKKAVKRGVDVKVIVPEDSDLKWFPLVNSFYYQSLIREGIKVYEYSKSILHAKSTIVDSWVSIGSSNLNSRSLKHDVEIDISVTEEINVKKIISQFQVDLCNSNLIKKSTLFRKYRHRQKLVFFYRAISYWL